MNHKKIMNAYLIVRKLDFTLIRMKLADREHGSSWPKSKIEEAELLYIAYLSILLAYRDTEVSFAPPALADEFWHQHILDTRKYVSDCLTLFGEYLHHFPYFGMRGPEDSKALHQATAQMQILLSTHFYHLPQYRVIIEKFNLDSCSGCAGGSCSSCRSIFSNDSEQISTTQNNN